MIEKMKKVYIVSTVSRKEEMLEALRDVGVLHLAERKSPDRSLSERFAALSKVDTVLKDYAKKDQKKADPLTDEEFEKLFVKTQEAMDRKSMLIQERSAAVSEAERIIDWGDFSPAQIRELRDLGCDLHFYRIAPRDLEAAVESPDVKLVRLASVDNMDTIAVIGKLPDDIPASEFVVPDKGLSDLRKEIADCDAGVEACDKDLEKASAYSSSFQQQMLKTQNEETFSAASHTAEEDEDFTWLTGYVPEADMDRFKDFASKNQLAWAADDPDEDDDQVPTKVRYNKVTRFIEPLFDILGILPGYREQDVSLWFLIFFTIFTAMIIGDGAYGCIFLAVAIGLTVKFKKVNNAIFLVYILSIATIVWGAITGTWFGTELAMRIPFLKALVIPNFSNYPELFGVTATEQQNTIMKFAFTLGVIQISLGCLLSIKKKVSEKNLSFVADIGWLIAVVSMYLLSLYLVIGQSINIVPVFAAIGVAFVIVVLFGGMSPDKTFSQGLKAGLGNAFTCFLDTISCFGNVMSYIRLFAVGMASLAIAQSFNDIAAGLKGPMVILAVVVLIIGHGLNLIMGLLSVVVHGVRLNVLEFSGQAGLEWTGIAYEPFKKKNKIKQ
jgi:V/A-type H+-transporting ATPase subunit I